MTSVAEAFVTLRPDMDRFEGEAKAGVGSKLLGIAAKATAAFSVAGGAAALFGVKAAASFQQTTIAFEGILGDAGKAKDLLGQLRDFAARTPFQFNGLAESARSLLAVGFTAQDIIPTMTKLGNVAATLGVGEAEIKGVVRALGQMKGKGKASAEELQQISEQIPGFSAIKVIAEDMGITVAEAFKLMEKGAIPADAAIDSILRGMENFPGAAGAMDRQSKTLNGVLSTLKDTVTNMAIDFITPYLPALSRGIERFSGFLSGTLVPGLHTVVDVVGQVVGVLFKGDFTGGPFEEDSSFIRGVFAVREGFQSFLTVVRDDVLPIVANLAEFVRTSLLPVIETLARFFIEKVAPAAGEVIKQLLALLGAVSRNEDLLKSIVVAIGVLLLPALTAWAIAAGIAAANTLLALAPIILVGAAIAGLAYIVIHNFDTIKSVISGVFGWVSDHWPLLLAILTGPFGLAVLAIVENFDRIKDAVQGAWHFIVNTWDSIWNFVEDRIHGAVEWVLRQIGRVTGPISSFLDQVGKLGGLVGGALGAVSGVVPHFALGGTVPGPIGFPQLAVVHGGERVLTPQQQTDSTSVIAELQALRAAFEHQEATMIRLARTSA